MFIVIYRYIAAPNPFGTNTVTATSTAMGNPFMAGGAGGNVPGANPAGTGYNQPQQQQQQQQQVPGGFAQFGQQPPAASTPGFANFGTPPASNVMPGMQNGGYGGQPQGQMAAWGQMAPQQGQMNAFPGGQPNAGMVYGAGASSVPAASQYNKMAQQPGYGTQGAPQQFGGWGAQPQAANPFMVSIVLHSRIQGH